MGAPRPVLVSLSPGFRPMARPVIVGMLQVGSPRKDDVDLYWQSDSSQTISRGFLSFGHERPSRLTRRPNIDAKERRDPFATNNDLLSRNLSPFRASSNCVAQPSAVHCSIPSSHPTYWSCSASEAFPSLKVSHLGNKQPEVGRYLRPNKPSARLRARNCAISSRRVLARGSIFGMLQKFDLLGLNRRYSGLEPHSTARTDSRATSTATLTSID